MKNAVIYLIRLAGCFALISTTSYGAVNFTVGNVTTAPGDFNVPVTVQNFNGVTALSFTLEWDSSVLTLQATGASDFGTPNTTYPDSFDNSQIQSGKLGFLWQDSSQNGVSIGSANDYTGLLFNLKFSAAGPGTSTVTFTDTVFSRLVEIKIPGGWTETDFGSQNGSVVVPVPEPASVALGIFGVGSLLAVGARWLAARRTVA